MFNEFILDCRILYLYNIFFACIVEKYSWLINGEAAAAIEKFMAEEHVFDEYCEEVDKFRALAKEIMVLPSIEHYDMVRLDCEDLKRGLSDVAKAHADTLLNRMATDHRDANAA